MFMDIKSAFPSVVLSQLTHDMRRSGVPEEDMNWIQRKVEGRCTCMTFDGYRSEARGLSSGIDQGCPLSGMPFQFYNADLLEIKD